MLLTATRAPNLNGFHQRDVSGNRVNHVHDYPSTPPRPPLAADSPPPLPSRSGSFVSQSSRRSGVVSELDAMRLMTALDSAGRSGPNTAFGADWNFAASSTAPDRRPRQGNVVPPSCSQERGTPGSYWATPVPARRVPAEADHRRFQQQPLPPFSAAPISSPQRQMSASTAVDQSINNAGVQQRGVWRMVGQQRTDMQTGISGSTLRQNSLSSSSSSTMGSNVSLHQPSTARKTPPPLPPPPASRTVREGPPRAVLQQQQQQQQQQDAMERQLAEREAELRSVRSTMEFNEQAILRAMDDQRRLWEAKSAEREAVWERRMLDVEEQAAGKQRAMEDRIRRLELENASTKTWRQLERMKQNDRLTEHRRPRPAGQSETETESEGKFRQSSSAMDRNNNTVSNEIDRDITSGPRPLKPQPVNGSASSAAGDRGQHNGTSPAGISSSSSSNLSGRLFSVTAATHSSESDEVESLVGSARGSHCQVPRRHRKNKDDGNRVAAELAPAAAATTSGGGGVDASSRDCCAAVRDELDHCRRQFDGERQRWTSEKASVVAYQKRLQGSYLELVRRCSALEDRLRAAGLVDPHEDGRPGCISDDPVDQFRVRRWDSMTLERVGLEDVVPHDRIY